MHLLPIRTPLLTPGDDLAAIIGQSADLQAGDIIVISSKAVATVEDAFIDLRMLESSREAEEWSAKTGRLPEFCEAVRHELMRLHGTVIGHCPGALLTEVRPEGLERGSILTANAGLDESNCPRGMAIGWPVDPVISVRSLRNSLEQSLFVSRSSFFVKNSNEKRKTKNEQTKSTIGLIITDSNCHPRRLGVTALALVVSGLDPLVSQAGSNDLFRKPLTITTEAIADQLATAANFLMGNAGQSIPAVAIRGHGIPLSRFEGWVPGIEREQDLFGGIV